MYKTPSRLSLSEDAITTLIKEVYKRPCLWNPEHDAYNDRFHIANAWKEISKILDNMPETVIKAKWKNLRDLFKRELRKFKLKTNGRYVGKWRYFKKLEFLHKPDEYVPAESDKDNNDNDNDSGDENDTESDQLEPVVKYEPDEAPEIEVFTDEDPISNKRMQYTDDDYDLMYLKSLTPYFRHLDPIRKLVVRSKIQDMLLNEIAAQGTSGSGKKS